MLKTTVGARYHILSQLGQGGFGTTFVAEDTQLPTNPKCVVKLLLPMATDPATLQIARRLFDTEAQVLYQLGKHPQIPQLFAYFEENNEFYLVQEFIEGHNLSFELTPPQTPPCQGNAPGRGKAEHDVLTLLQDILEILDFVHLQNVIHRDVNPSNIIRRAQDGKLVLIDFGAVKQITTQMLNRSSTVQTRPSICIGTPGYMPSEQANGNPKQSSDIYAVGTIGIQALTGLLPNQFPKDSATDEINWHELPPVSPELAQVLDKMMRYDFRQRYQSASEALQALKALKNLSSLTVALSPAPVSPIITKKSRANLLKGLISVVGIGMCGAVSVSLVGAINSSNATYLYNRGNTLYNLNRYAEALAAYQKATEIRQDFAEAWKEQGATLYNLKRYADALEAYDKAIQIKSDYLEAWNGRGLVLGRRGRYEEAIASFNKALNIQEDYADAWNGKGDSLLSLLRYEEAVESYDKAVDFKSDYSEAWYSRGWALHNLQKYTEAVESYDKAVEFKSDYYQAWYNRGNSLVQLNKYKDAVESYEKAVRSKPDYYLAWNSLGNSLSYLQEYKEAVRAYEKAVQLKQDYWEGWYNLGWSLHQLRRYEKAIEYYEKVIQLQPNDYKAWYAKGNALYNLSRYEEAIASYERVVVVQQEHYESWYSRGNALFNLKRYEEAIASYDKAVQFQPNYREAIQAKKKAQKKLDSGKGNSDARDLSTGARKDTE